MNPLDLVNIGSTILNKVLDFIPDPVQKMKAQQDMMAQLMAAAQTQNGQQVDIDTNEAKSGSLFVAGWRPMIGWVCATALAFQYLLRPLMGTLLPLITKQHFDIPGLDDNLWQLMLGMLGMGGLRTLEKFGGVQTMMTTSLTGASKK